MKNAFVITVSLFFYHVVIAQNTATSIRGTFFDGAEDHPSFEINSNYNGWDFIDKDNAPTQYWALLWPGAGEPMAYMAFVPSETEPPSTLPEIQPYAGNKFFIFFSNSDVPFINNKWMITPILSHPVKFSFWAKSFVSHYGLERIKIAYSISGKEEDDFVYISPGPYVQISEVWTFYEFDIPQEAKYAAINYVSNDMFLLMVDDITIEQLLDTCEAVNDLTSDKFNVNSILLTWTKPESDLQIEGYRIFRNGQLLNEDLFTVTTYFDENLPDGDYEYCVITYYTSGCISSASNHVRESIELEVKEVKEVKKLEEVRVYPNPTTGELKVKSEELRVESVAVFDVCGRKVFEQKAEGRKQKENSPPFMEGWQPQADGVVINISHLNPCIYFIKITTEKGIITKKIVKQ